MTVEEFRESAANPLSAQPKGLSEGLLALWHDAHGDWPKAHACVQHDPGRLAAWVHAYLHRKEGDVSNARYWYVCAGRPEATGAHSSEWAELVSSLFSVSGKASTARPAAG